ncbi:thiaminase II [Anaerosporobacter sp.]
MTIMERLLYVTKEIWEEYNKHPFVIGIQEGTLDRKKFKYYIIQDYLYLEEYAKVFAIGIAKAKSPELTKLFSNYVNLLTGSEMDIHRGYMGKFEISQQEIDETPRALDNLSYTSYMLRVAYEEGEAEILTAILSCAYSYEIIAKNMIKNNPDSQNHSFYGEWIQGYANEQYSEENKVLINTLEKITSDYSEEQMNHLIDIFVACSRYELAFWDLAWNMSL